MIVVEPNKKDGFSLAMDCSYMAVNGDSIFTPSLTPGEYFG